MIRDILSNKYVILSPIKCTNHFGPVLRFAGSGEYIAVHHFVGFSRDSEQFFIGFPNNPISAEEFNIVLQYVEDRIGRIV